MINPLIRSKRAKYNLMYIVSPCNYKTRVYHNNVPTNGVNFYSDIEGTINTNKVSENTLA